MSFLQHIKETRAGDGGNSIEVEQRQKIVRHKTFHSK